MLRRSFLLPCAAGLRGQAAAATAAVSTQVRTPRRICYLTDVEGNMRYFQRFVQMSACLRWEKVSQLSPPTEAASGTDNPSEVFEGYVELDEEDFISKHDVEVNGIRLTFKDAFTHFVYGGDAFDHGADLSFGTALLDFKRRFPDRVHFILGNRDINKMVMVPFMQEVEAKRPAEAEQMIFPHHRQADALRPAEMHYTEFLKHEGLSESTPASRVTFLKWALKNKMGSPNAFENRRRELALLRQQARGSTFGESEPFSNTQSDDEKRREDTTGEVTEADGAAVTDGEVAESFFDAARPGGVYYELIRHGVLALALDGILFVHGGVNAQNVGFVPDTGVLDFAEQANRGRHFLKEGRDALAWVAALNRFKDECFEEWRTATGMRGEAVRRYVFPRSIVPYSVTVGSFVDVDGPQMVTLPAMQYLLESGLHTVCGGHQPTGDSPAIVRQPGGFLMLDADNSYSGRDNEYCTPENKRGLAVQEVIFRVEGDLGNSDDDNTTTGEVEAAVASWDVGSVTCCGLQADGRPFHFNLDEHPLMGRYLGDGWWVKLPLYRSDTIGHEGAPGDTTLVPVQTEEGSGQEAPLYELHRTRDGFRGEEVRTVTTEKLKELLAEYQRTGHVPIPGELEQRFTKEELAEVHVHRIKTKVSRTETEQG